MTSEASSQTTSTSRSGVFAETHWSVVVRAGRSDSTHARAALEELCRSYWPPIYAYIRRLGHSPHDAQDLTQEFFAKLLAKNWLADANRSRGRFRSFLLVALKHFLANEWDKARTQKRGGNALLIPIDATRLETSVVSELSDQLTADKLFDRRWALALLDQVLQCLREEHARDGKPQLFDALKPTLTEASRSVRYREIAARLQMSEGALKVAVHRLRHRYRELIRAKIAQTLSNPDDVEDELRSLFSALGA